MFLHKFTIRFFFQEHGLLKRNHLLHNKVICALKKKYRNLKLVDYPSTHETSCYNRSCYNILFDGKTYMQKLPVERQLFWQHFWKTNNKKFPNQIQKKQPDDVSKQLEISKENWYLKNMLKCCSKVSGGYKRFRRKVTIFGNGYKNFQNIFL